MKKKELIRYINELLIQNAAANLEIEILDTCLVSSESALEYKEKKLEMAYKKIGELMVQDE